MYGVSAPVTVKVVEPHECIVIQWPDVNGPTTVEWRFTPREDGSTFVAITNRGFTGTGTRSRCAGRRQVRRWPIELQRAALRKLLILDAADAVGDLRTPPGNRLEKLGGDRAGQYSIRVNDQWRICFRWRDRDAYDVAMTDDHQERVMPEERLPPIHPGEVLLEEFLDPLGISQYRLAKDISVPPRRINEVVHGERSITADTALRLARCFGTSERFRLNLQARYDLEFDKDRLGDRLDREVLRRAV